MTNREIRKEVKAFRKKFGLSDCNLANLKSAAEAQGYTVVEYNHIYNDEHVQILIDELNLSDNVLRSKGFTYADENHRLLFVHEDLNAEEKVMILAHENGHIFLQHMSNLPVLGRDVSEEYEANEFAHYLLDKSFMANLSLAFRKYKKAFIVAAVVAVMLVAGVMVFNFTQKTEQYHGEYYITLSGSKYHEKDCIFVKNKDNVRRLTQEDFESGDYEPCKTCLP